MNDNTPLMFDDDALDAARTRRLKVAGGVAGLAAMAAIAVSAVVFTGSGSGSGSDEVAAPLAAAATADSVPDTVPDDDVDAEPATPEGDEPPRTFEVFSSKNPFVPLADTTPAAPAGGTPTIDPVTGLPTTGTTPTDPTTPTGTTPTGTTPTTLVPEPGSTSSTTTPPRTTEPRAAQRVEVIDIFTDAAGVLVANVKVNDTVHQELAVGESFATSYKVVSLSQADKCGVFLYGDDSFNLCVGEQLLK